MRNHCSWDYDYQQSPQKQFKTSDERKQGRIKTETWFCYYFFNPEVLTRRACGFNPWQGSHQGDLSGRDMQWLEPTPSVHPLNHQEALKAVPKLKRRVVFGSKDMFVSLHVQPLNPGNADTLSWELSAVLWEGRGPHALAGGCRAHASLPLAPRIHAFSPRLIPRLILPL